LRRELGASLAAIGGPFGSLQELGISAELNGKLSIDAVRLDAAFAADFDAIGEVFADVDAGLAFRLDTLLEPYLQSGGVLDGRNGTLKATIDDITDRREALTQRLGAVEQRLFRQFNALDGLLAQLQSTSAYLTQQLSNLPRADLLLGRNR
jgi:flagellar hook-associated protein 2